MGLLSIFKSPVNETLATICAVYHRNLTSTKSSKMAFVSMANEAFNQLKIYKRTNFSNVKDTYAMLSGIEFDDLSDDHEDNREYLQNYLCNIMTYIRADYYNSEDWQKMERLKVMVETNLR